MSEQHVLHDKQCFTLPAGHQCLWNGLCGPGAPPFQPCHLHDCISPTACGSPDCQPLRTCALLLCTLQRDIQGSKPVLAPPRHTGRAPLLRAPRLRCADTCWAASCGSASPSPSLHPSVRPSAACLPIRRRCAPIRPRRWLRRWYATLLCWCRPRLRGFLLCRAGRHCAGSAHHHQ